eukprot:UN02764
MLKETSTTVPIIFIFLFDHVSELNFRLLCNVADKNGYYSNRCLPAIRHNIVVFILTFLYCNK